MIGRWHKICDKGAFTLYRLLQCSAVLSLDPISSLQALAVVAALVGVTKENYFLVI